MRRTPLNAGWSFAERRWADHSPKMDPLPATVPGHVHLDLVRHGIIAHPFERLHELGCQWVDEADFRYELAFDADLDGALPTRILRFSGLDTVCAVSLNGERIAVHDNMFVPLELDVSARLRPGRNELQVDFSSASRTGRERRKAYFASEGLPDELLRFDDRAFVRKAQYMFGWDWGPRLVSAGIWGEVELIECAGRLLDVQVTQRHASDGSVELAMRSEVQGDFEAVHFVEGFASAVSDGEPLMLRRPELWWPAGFGAQHLYTVTTLLVPRGARKQSRARGPLEARAVDSRVQRIGVRTVRLIRRDDADGQSFEFEVNGRSLWAVGANWIPDSSFPAEVSRERVRAALARARDMNMNMLRVWGGGLYESDDFYDGCDELGILVWQDFPFACSYYPDGPEDQAELRVEAAHAVRRLRNRASLALWCGNNENLTMFESKWGEPRRHPRRYYGEALYEHVLPEVLAELDPERPYIPTSPWGGPLSNSDGVGDQHYWDVWHGRGDWKHYVDSRARFASEFGFAAAPGRAAWKRIAPHAPEPLALSVRDSSARFHDKTEKGYETFIGYVELHYPTAQNVEEWVYFSQLNQRDALRHGIEHYRRSDFCKGTLIWQLNDCWPVQSWAVVDGEGAYKAAAFELRRLYADALVSVVVSDTDVRVFAILDNTDRPRRGSVELQARSLSDGTVLRAWQADAALTPGERKLALAVSRKDLEHDPTATILVASFCGSTTFRLLCEPKAARLAAPQLAATVAEGSVLLRSDVPVVDLFVWEPAGAVEFLDNFVTLPAGGEVRLRTRGAGAAASLCARSLAGAHEVEIDLGARPPRQR